MTIKEYLSGIQALSTARSRPGADGQTMTELLAMDTPIWSNDACRGYLIATLRLCGQDREQILTALDAMDRVFAEKTVDEATLTYSNY